MLQEENKAITPRRLIMSLFNAPDTVSLTIGQLITAATIFEIEVAALRMAVSRLIKEQLIASTERGVYTTGAKAIGMNSEIQSWRHADKKIKEWAGDWSIALTGHLGRTNKTQLRSMTKALELYGFVEIELGVWLRPANLVQELDQLKASLVEIGMDSRAYLMRVSKVADDQQQNWHLNWPIEELEAGYLKMIEALEVSQISLNSMNYQEAAKESLITGEAAIRMINLDPLLPRELVNAELFRDLVTHMIAYDKIGQAHWQQLLSS